MKGRPLDLSCTEHPTTALVPLEVAGRPGDANHDVELVVVSSISAAATDDFEQLLRITPARTDGEPNLDVSVIAIMAPKASPSLESLVIATAPLLGADTLVRHGAVASSYGAEGVAAGPGMSAEDELAEELETLRLLETAAESLQTRIAAKKQLIAEKLKDEREHMALCDLLDECDGIVCQARVVAQRIYDKVGLFSESSLDWKQNPQLQRTSSGHTDVPQTARNRTKSRLGYRPIPPTNATAQGLHLPIHVTKNGTNTSSSVFNLDLGVDVSNPLVRALGIIAALLGIAAICRFIRRRCMSMRKRVERAADREERRNARAYRKAARRAARRKQWHGFVRAIPCFRVRGGETRSYPRDYEEKRALILQDAFLEHMTDLDQAEKGEVMEAEIRELRHAHELVASLVRAGDEQQPRAGPVSPPPFIPHDPPPPMVPLPYTPASRSRASTGTLPSYTSESPPDYASRPATLVGGGGSSVSSDSLVDAFPAYTAPAPGSTAGDGRRSPDSADGSTAPVCTPVSSIRAVSPRPSAETLRTRQSKDSGDY